MMFFFKLQDGRILNIDQIVLIAMLETFHGARLTLTNGMVITLVNEDWDKLEPLIDSYSWKDELK
jgi:hypothetical protein